MGAKFTWHEKFTRALEKVPDEMLPQLVRAVCAYGTDGVEPDLAFPLDVVFEAFREDIDYSKNARKSGSKGGRASRGPEERGQGSPGDPEDPRKGSENPSKGSENPCEDGGDPSNPIHSNTEHSNTEHSRAGRGEDGGKRTRFRPPTPDEVSAYANERGTPVDAARFCDFYGSKGWKVGSSPMRDWRAAVRTWAARDGRKGVPESAGDEYSRL